MGSSILKWQGSYVGVSFTISSILCSLKSNLSAYLAKKYINDNIVNDSIKLQLLIKDGIESWMENELSDNPKKSKPSKKVKISQLHGMTNKNDQMMVEPIHKEEKVVAIFICLHYECNGTLWVPFCAQKSKPKIDPKSIGVGQYQHDVDQKKLQNKLKTIIKS